MPNSTNSRYGSSGSGATPLRLSCAMPDLTTRSRAQGHSAGQVRETGCPLTAGIWVSLDRKYAGIGVSELWELRRLREENARLKRLVADLSLDKHILQDVLAKKV